MTRPHTPPADPDAALEGARGADFDAGTLMRCWREQDARAARLRHERIAAAAARAIAMALIVILFAAAAFVLLGWRTPAVGTTLRMHLAPGDFVCFAIVVIDNRAGHYNAVETLDTPHGPVALRYTTIGGHNATDHDRVAVVSLPDGVAADPMDMEIPDGEQGQVCLMLYLGG
ncbi:MAG: hypothetical protein ACK4OP_01540 [Gemmobacter sp.]